MSDPAQTPPWQHARLGITPDQWALHNSRDNHLAALQLLSQARRECQVLSSDLDPRVFDHQDVADALSALARSSRSARINLLVTAVDDIARRGHLWLKLIQRLSTAIEVRVLHEDYTHLPFCFLIVDRNGLLYRSNAAEYEATLSFHAPQSCQEKLRWFQEAWDRSRPASELRRLHI